LAEAAADFSDLAGHVAAGRPIIIIGHSLGAYIATRSAALLGDQAPGLVLIDASHPAEMRRSARQAAGAEMLNTTLRLMAPSMRLGLGALLLVPQAVDRLPEEARQAAVAQYRDSRLWTAAHREWKATFSEFGAFRGKLPRIDSHVLVLSAAATLEDDPVQLELHREYVAAATRGAVHVIEGADHDTVLTASECTAAVIEHISTFVVGLGEAR
jgi:pimeloyl-ACP methyl ester carboxylesterase